MAEPPLPLALPPSAPGVLLVADCMATSGAGAIIASTLAWPPAPAPTPVPPPLPVPGGDGAGDTATEGGALGERAALVAALEGVGDAVLRAAGDECPEPRDVPG